MTKTAYVRAEAAELSAPHVNQPALKPVSFAALRRLSVRPDGMPRHQASPGVVNRLTRDALAVLEGTQLRITPQGRAVVAAFMADLDHDPDRFDCDTCGAGVPADEDGCCAYCGATCWVIDCGVPILDPDGDSVEPYYSQMQAREGIRPASLTPSGCP